MERLTRKSWRNLDPWETCGQDNYCKRRCHEQSGCTKGCIVPRIYARLAAYEDTGLEPEEIRYLGDLRETDSSEYKMWGNGISLPTALYVMQGIAEALKGGEG